MSESYRHRHRYYWCNECAAWTHAYAGVTSHEYACSECGEHILCDECGAVWTDQHAEVVHP